MQTIITENNVQRRVDRAMKRAGFSERVTVRRAFRHDPWRDVDTLEFSCPSRPELATRARDWAAKAIHCKGESYSYGIRYSVPLRRGDTTLDLAAWKIGE